MSTPGSAAGNLQQLPQEDNPLAAGRRSTLLGAMFLMATAAIGPGFITQTTTFTVQLGASFAFAILISVVFDIAAQMNTWRVIGVSGQRVQDLGNAVLPGVGYFLAALVVLGGLVFNVGNIAGGGLAFNAMLGIDHKLGAALSGVLAIAVFLSRKAGVAIDRLVVVLGLAMIALTGYVALVSQPPVGEVLKHSVLPESIDFFVVLTLIGGTVGGYMTYAGGHRLLDSGISGVENLREISRASVTGIVITGVIRWLLFLAIFGVISGGAVLSETNPSADAFEAAAGEFGLRLFGIVLWAAVITSVIGSAYTSVSFLTSLSSTIAKRRVWVIVFFIAFCTVVFLLLGRPPVTLLIFAGAFNGMILPVGFSVILWVAARRRDMLRGYRYPKWLLSIGLLAWLMSLFLGYASIRTLFGL